MWSWTLSVSVAIFLYLGYSTPKFMFSVCFPSIEFSIYTLLYLWIYWKYHSWMDSAHDSISREWQVHYNARGVRDICWGFKFIPYDFLSWPQRIQPFIYLPIQIESNTHHFSSYFIQQSFKWLNTLHSLKIYLQWKPKRCELLEQTDSKTYFWQLDDLYIQINNHKLNYICCFSSEWFTVNKN